MYDICCVGHITSDKVVTTQSELYMPGGTAWYFSWALSQLPLNYLLVTAVGNTELHYVNQLQEKNIEVLVQPSAHTVFFENIYEADQDKRTQNVLQKADPFSAGQFNDITARIFHLGPLLADDISTSLIKTLATKGRVSLDVQGYLRRVENQKVYATNWTDRQEALQHVSILKADVAELATLSGCDTVTDGAKTLAAWGVAEVVITNGSQGSQVYCEGVLYDIPAYAPPVITDATGCGDTYMAGYLYKRSQGAGIQESGEFAAAMAGLKTARSGPFMGTETDIERFKLKS
jgi:sugar/nucleoside kinase (ribokinase family)